VGQGKFAGQRPAFYHCATQPTIPNNILIDSAIFAGLTNVTNRHRDRQTDRRTLRQTTLYSVCYIRPHLCYTEGMRFDAFEMKGLKDSADFVDSKENK